MDTNCLSETHLLTNWGDGHTSSISGNALPIVDKTVSYPVIKKGVVVFVAFNFDVLKNAMNAKTLMLENIDLYTLQDFPALPTLENLYVQCTHIYGNGRCFFMRKCDADTYLSPLVYVLLGIYQIPASVQFQRESQTCPRSKSCTWMDVLASWASLCVSNAFVSTWSVQGLESQRVAADSGWDITDSARRTVSFVFALCTLRHELVAYVLDNRLILLYVVRFRQESAEL